MSAAFGCITSITNGKAWTNALRAYRLIIALLLRRFYSNGAKTYQELSDYLEAAREHSTGRLWVDCLIKPTLCSHMLHAAADGVQTIRIISDDTDVFVLLVYWTSRMRVVDNIQTEKWNGDARDVNKTIVQLGLRKCSPLIGLHALSGCDTASYPFGKGKKVSDHAPGDRYTRQQAEWQNTGVDFAEKSRQQYHHFGRNVHNYLGINWSNFAHTHAAKLVVEMGKGDSSYLWSKLISNGINGKLMSVIFNLYHHAKSCVRANVKISDYFTCNVGVRQGEHLSPSVRDIFE